MEEKSLSIETALDSEKHQILCMKFFASINQNNRKGALDKVEFDIVPVVKNKNKKNKMKAFEIGFYLQPTAAF